jgi:hypothetical protein
MRLAFFLAATLIASGGVLAQTNSTAHVDEVEIIEAGLFAVGPTEQIDDQGVISGRRRLVDNSKLIESTNVISGRLGSTFGFRYKLVGEPSGAVVALKVITKFPAKLRNPKTGDEKTDDEYVINRTIGDVHFRGYGFDNEWEIIPGKWSFELWLDDRKLTEQTFEVVGAK